LTIFVTGHPEYAVDAFEQFAFNYILKPVDKKIFEKVIDRAVEEIDKIKEIQKGRFFNLVNKKTMSSIPYKDLFYFEKRINKISVKLTNDEIEARKTLKKIEEEIDTSFFIRCHKSFIVNKEKILYQQGDNLILLGCSDLIPIGKKYRENVMKEIGKMINIRE
jgi:DNA-binding LytR/AlgR family response regulator